MDGYWWLCLIMLGYTWLCLVMHGYTYSVCLVMLGYGWLWVHSKKEGMKHIPTRYDSHTFSFHTMGMKKAFTITPKPH